MFEMVMLGDVEIFLNIIFIKKSKEKKNKTSGLRLEIGIYGKRNLSKIINNVT